MTKAMTKAKTKLREFRQRANFLPKNLASRGAVSTPTMTNVVTNAAMAPISAPCLIKDEANGKAIKAGMRTIEPKTAARMIPWRPASGPIVFRMCSDGRKVRMKPMAQMIATMDGARDRSDRPKNRRAARVLPRLFVQDRRSPTPAIPQITAAKPKAHLTCMASTVIFVAASIDRRPVSFGTRTQLNGRAERRSASATISPSPSRTMKTTSWLMEQGGIRWPGSKPMTWALSFSPSKNTDLTGPMSVKTDDPVELMQDQTAHVRLQPPGSRP
ncbi:MAG: hypothetical protein MZV63_65795 [Marinilabiliales bacterium]|nr:hypothetical protein [Marinilabiliales bacterium]